MQHGFQLNIVSSYSKSWTLNFFVKLMCCKATLPTSVLPKSSKKLLNRSTEPSVISLTNPLDCNCFTVRRGTIYTVHFLQDAASGSHFHPHVENWNIPWCACLDINMHLTTNSHIIQWSVNSMKLYPLKC